MVAPPTSKISRRQTFAIGAWATTPAAGAMLLDGSRAAPSWAEATGSSALAVARLAGRIRQVGNSRGSGSCLHSKSLANRRVPFLCCGRSRAFHPALQNRLLHEGLEPALIRIAHRYQDHVRKLAIARLLSEIAVLGV